MAFQRPPITSSKNVDVFRFYIGPKKTEILSRYNDGAMNRFGISDLHIDEVAPSPILIEWLSQLLKWTLELFYSLIPNYGISIILLTLLIKLIFLPLTFRSSDSTARMQALTPRINEIRERLKNTPEKVNQEIAKVYKKEKINPVSGCLPLLLQLPIFFALYRVLNNYFELRGAMFIPGLIADLSAPETVWDFSPFTIPPVGMHAIRGLPFIMLLTQVAQSRFGQSGFASNQQMKLVNYAMPVVFFFILYDMPSGLVIYWTVQNIFSIFQQLYFSRLSKKRRKIAMEKVRS